jgi:uncharacterized protein
VGLKFLLLVVVLAVAIGWVLSRSRRAKKGRPPVSPPRQESAKDEAQPVTMAMLSCAHCQVHLPKDDALFDVAGRPYCGAEHRVAGPR